MAIATMGLSKTGPTPRQYDPGVVIDDVIDKVEEVLGVVNNLTGDGTPGPVTGTTGNFTGNVTLGNATTDLCTIEGELDHDGDKAGFYGTAPIAKQTGVAVTAEAIHAALVALGLIAA